MDNDIIIHMSLPDVHDILYRFACDLLVQNAVSSVLRCLIKRVVH